ncbi:MAG: type II toxin-antitoxin system VapC family toxin [Candidatus Obscuribacterales bacterium]|nr:type II toxin-antitoxin system VapC family toxin [Candidatus Obscuribacterales bacterium]
MSFLLDTCVVSEFVAPRPNQAVTKWLHDLVEESAYLSVVTIGEIRRGISRTPSVKRRDMLAKWLHEELLIRFDNRILPLDTGVLLDWGEFTGSLANEGRPMPIMDSLIAATAVHHGLTVVTRDTEDFSRARVRVFNPWK